MAITSRAKETGSIKPLFSKLMHLKYSETSLKSNTDQARLLGFTEEEIWFCKKSTFREFEDCFDNLWNSSFKIAQARTVTMPPGKTFEEVYGEEIDFLPLLNN